MKKLISVLVVLMLVLSSCTVAFATENSTFTLGKVTENITETTLETTPLAKVGTTTTDTTETVTEATEQESLSALHPTLVSGPSWLD